MVRFDDPPPPHRSVYALLEDQQGFLWIGTLDGLARFDGYEMVTFRHDPNDPETLSSNTVNVLLEDRGNTLWIGTTNGLDRLDRSTMTAQRVELPSSTRQSRELLCATEDSSGALWFGTLDGLYRIDPANLGTTRYDAKTLLAHGCVTAVAEDRSGVLWVLSKTALRAPTATLQRLRGETFEDAGTVDHDVRPMVFDALGQLWLHPLLSMRPAASDEDGQAAVSVLSGPAGTCAEPWAALGSDSSVWFACNDGLWRRDLASQGLERVPVVPGAAWLENYGRALLEDRTGTIWVGTQGGLYALDPNAKLFRAIRQETESRSGLTTAAVSSVLVDPSDGGLWVGTFGGGINRVDTAGSVHQWCVRHYPDCAHDVIWDLHLDASGSLLAASDIHGLIESSNRSMPDALTASLFRIASTGSDLWFAAEAGQVHRYSPVSGRLSTMVVDRSQMEIDSLLVHDGSVWAASGRQLARIDPHTGSIKRWDLQTNSGTSLHSQGSWMLHPSPDGFWIGTSIGLLHFDREQERFTCLTTHDGLPGSAVYSILEHDDGRLWLGTNLGLSRFDPTAEPGDRFRTFTIEDGTGNTEYNRHAAAQRADGTMVFGGMDGLTIFHPDEIRDNPIPPPVRLTRIVVSSRDGERLISPHELGELTLSHRDSTVAFTFAALSYTSAERNRYRYRLDGFETAWVEARTRRTCQYTSIPPGRYRFQVTGSNSDGIFNEQPLSLQVRVQPAYWQAWWFRPTVLTVLLLVVAGALRLRVLRQRRLQRLRLGIASDLHDDLSSDLSGIAVVSDVLRRKRELDQSDREDLSEIRDTALGLVEGVRDIVWYIDPEHDTLHALTDRMRTVAGILLRSLEHSFEVEGAEQPQSVHMTVRRNLLLLFKEALHNIVRHAEATMVTVMIHVSGSSLRLMVIDDGCGFSAQRTNGHGLRSMQRRAAEIGADWNLLSTPGGGTRIELTVDLTGFRDGIGWRSWIKLVSRGRARSGPDTGGEA